MPFILLRPRRATTPCKWCHGSFESKNKRDLERFVMQFIYRIIHSAFSCGKSEKVRGSPASQPLLHLDKPLRYTLSYQQHIKGTANVCQPFEPFYITTQSTPLQLDWHPFILSVQKNWIGIIVRRQKIGHRKNVCLRQADRPSVLC